MAPHSENCNAAQRAALDPTPFGRFCATRPRLAQILANLANIGLIVLVFLVVIVLINGQSKYFLRSVGKQATASVSEAGAVVSATGKLKTTVAYAFKTSDGDEVRCVNWIESLAQLGYEKGSRVVVLYDPVNPQHNHIEAHLSTDARDLVLTLAQLVAALMMLGLYSLMYRRYRRAAAIGAEV